jgi:hypothetical protein
MSNEKVLHRTNTHRQILNVIRQRKTSYLEHILLQIHLSKNHSH